MPYKKRAPQRRRYRRGRRKPMTRYATYSRAGTQLWKDVSMLKNLINVEFKQKDVTFSSQTIYNTYSSVLLNGLTKGDDNSNRDGRRVRFKSLQFNGTVYLDSVATASTVRFILFIDKQPNAANGSGNLLDNNTINGQRSVEYARRFTVLKDFTVNLSASGLPQKAVKFYVPLDMKTDYDDSDTGLISDITRNSMYLYMVSDDTVANPVVLNGHLRLRFIDN